MRYLLTLLLVLFACNAAKANNIQVTNGDLAEQNTAEGYFLVEFDLTWENSWRTDNLFPADGHAVGNWDAAWVFIKYRVGFGEWQHAKLHNSGHTPGSGTPATIAIGLPNERADFHTTDNPGVGAFIYRSENGTGTFTTTGNRLRWNYGADDIPDDAYLTIRIFAVEMVYVAPGPFWLGSGVAEAGSFFAGAATSSSPFWVTESWDGCISNTEGCLWGNTIAGRNTIGDPGSLNPDFPNGYDGFYSMKYPISQQQYVDFLNTLPPAQATARAYTGGGFRNGITLSDGMYQTSNPFVANNFMSWMDGVAFTDWAGLRLMTEIEFEKAARGPADPVPNEYAWGNTSSVRATSLTNAGQPNEAPVPAHANTNFMVGSTPDFGPIRVGAFAYNSTTREESGASYWGIMELSGNVWERTVSVGNDSGRGFTGLHGNGVLASNGNGMVENWPGNGSNGIGSASGSGFRGGSLSDQEIELSVSRRFSASFDDISRFQNYGFRAVRSLPAAVAD